MTWFKDKEELENWLKDRPPREFIISTSAEFIDAFEKAVIEDIERIKGHKVIFSRKNRK